MHSHKLLIEAEHFLFALGAVMSKLVNKPSGLELVEETTQDGFRDWMIQMLGGRLGGLPQPLIDAVNDPATMLAPLLKVMRPGDQLWRCRSEKRAPLYGHEGIAVVRDGRPVLYMHIWQY
ncbi:hypothetical protein AB4Z13_02650 [Rhizobium sp. YAF28]|uniref:hypothetical protein n=1 Tax=Rhizobium sp. YAF28 TaxID=3233081 RepID=UPI003F9A568F